MERLTPLPWQRELWSRLTGWTALPHALLLHGARGIGKHRLAEAFAAYLLCESPREGLACGECSGCQLISADNHPDLRRLVPEADLPERDIAEGEEEPAPRESRTRKPSSEILIDQVREIGEFLGVSAHRGGRRVVLLSPAEALNGPAANALLKLLEEPPGNAVFVAVTDELDAVLPTIRSRCVLVRAQAPQRDAALAWLREQGADDAESRLAEAGGAPFGIEPGAQDEEDPRRLDPELKQTLLKLLARGGTLTAAEVAAAVPRDIPVSEAIRLFQRWGWDLLAERLASRVRYYPQQRRALTTLSQSAEPVRLAGWLAQLQQAQAASDHPLNARLVIENALLGYVEAMRPQQRAGTE
jgi:DNA polymerase-3 subunit delta'